MIELAINDLSTWVAVARICLVPNVRKRRTSEWLNVAVAGQRYHASHAQQVALGVGQLLFVDLNLPHDVVSSVSTSAKSTSTRPQTTSTQHALPEQVHPSSAPALHSGTRCSDACLPPPPSPSSPPSPSAPPSPPAVPPCCSPPDASSKQPRPHSPARTEPSGRRWRSKRERWRAGRWGSGGPGSGTHAGCPGGQRLHRK